MIPFHGDLEKNDLLRSKWNFWGSFPSLIWIFLMECKLIHLFLRSFEEYLRFFRSRSSTKHKKPEFNNRLLLMTMTNQECLTSHHRWWWCRFCWRFLKLLFLKINRVSFVQKSKTKEVWEQRIGIQFQWVINHP